MTQKQLIEKFWTDLAAINGNIHPEKTKQTKAIRKKFIVECTQLVEDRISEMNAAQEEILAGEELKASKKKSSTKRVKDEAESGDPKSKKVVIIEPKAKKSTTKKAESPVPTKKKSATSNKK